MKSSSTPPTFEPARIERLEQAIADGHQFGTILAAPPWESLSVDDICALPVTKLAAADAHLYLWSTAPLLPKALAVIKAWGFRFETEALWVKTDFAPEPSDFWLEVTEDLLLGVRGNQNGFMDRTVDSVFEAPVGPNGEKPSRHSVIERCSPGPYLELFARSVTPGWSAYLR